MGINIKRLMADLYELGKIGFIPGKGTSRVAYSEDFLKGRELIRSKMEEAGLLNRLRRPDSRRSFLIELTEAGRAKAREVHACFSELDECIWQGFDRKEMETLLEILKKININLEERQQ